MQVFKHHWLLKIQFQSTRLSHEIAKSSKLQCSSLYSATGRNKKKLEKREVRSHNKVRLSARTFSQK